MALFSRKKTVEVVEEVEERPTLPAPPAPNEAGLRRVDDHRDYLLSLVDPLPPFGMHLIDALGLALCEDIEAPMPQPRHAVSDIAGYAVQHDDLFTDDGSPATLTVVEVESGSQLSAGEAAIVHEQGPVPAGADTVVHWSATDQGETTVTVNEAPAPGTGMRAAGSDIADQDLVARAGQVLDDRSVAVLSALGIDKVLARPRPRVVVISQGIDLVEPGRRLTDDAQVYDTTGVLVAAGAKQAGCQVWRVLVPTDDPALVREAITDQLIRADLVITTGGLLDAENSVVRAVLDDIALCDFAEVAVRPGRRQGFALVGEDKVPLVVLPTNPVAAHASFHAFVRPLLRRLAGAEVVENPGLRAFTGTVVRSPKGLTSISRAIVHDEGGRHRVEVLPHTSTDQLSGLTRCNALVVINDDREAVSAGESLVCWMLDRD